MISEKDKARIMNNLFKVKLLALFSQLENLLRWLLHICTTNHMFDRAIWDKLPECIFENFEIALVKQGEFQNFQKSRE